MFRVCGDRADYILAERWRCRHDTRNPSTEKLDPNKAARRTKNTKCPFAMIIKLKKQVELGTKSCNIQLDWSHNHPLQSLAVSMFNDILPETAEKVMEYFDQGLSPGKMIFLYLLDPPP